MGANATVTVKGEGACSLCHKISASSAQFWNVPLFESSSLTVVPSVGALVEGWLLIVPKTHAISSGALPKHLARDLYTMTRFVYESVSFIYGTACIFEHGAVARGRAVGCGVDHAHVHVAPVECDLVAAVSPLSPTEVRWRDADMVESCREAFEAGDDYLYVEQALSQGKIAQGPLFGSQLFRRAIAANAGVEEQFNWRDFPQIPTVEATVKKLESVSFAERLQRVAPAA
jgi:diadenosine tetraphosphate (Ap4A) HIT family hydrolase